METLMFELKKITSGQKNLEQQLIEMKAGHASPVDDQDDGLPPLPVQTEESFLELEGMIKDTTLANKLVRIF